MEIYCLVCFVIALNFIRFIRWRRREVIILMILGKSPLKSYLAKAKINQNFVSIFSILILSLHSEGKFTGQFNQLTRYTFSCHPD